MGISRITTVDNNEKEEEEEEVEGKRGEKVRIGLVTSPFKQAKVMEEGEREEEREGEEERKWARVVK